ncbi:[FeFe] hydrogenase H-cluster maturation GTPase HydF [Breznakia pachnodae]|uniref:[FeFe] hydrogenase H-cluster maturation GTPase HydF n=1 Tax=Breznakia pachnodae TaxID=265178 RepID=A0ABU0E423_9FIRM|nr:[FeFe] hydrogenase H-cluster maturation GTPase HydF [Breznakia pachnodae]MDQ0361649.1 [FeFe] hydrogenase H-cluster maturation GTPase HydF [Breznakia pachnodae]
MGLQNTPHANRLHIGIFGKVNSGKSTLLNTLTKQSVAIVSDKEGTTTDPIYKAMELHGIGPVVFIDTAGFGDVSELGEQRMEKTRLAAQKSDIAIVMFADEEIEEGVQWYQFFKELNITTLLVVNDTNKNDTQKIKELVEATLQEDVMVINAKADHTDEIRKAIIRLLPEDYGMDSITKSLAKEDDLVMLVMPQDIQAPKGRLILPQVQTIRDLLDKKCIVVSCTTDKIDQTLQSLSKEPDLIICDSQVFKIVYDKKPEKSKLTSFSVLFADYKGDIHTFVEGANAIDKLTKDSKVLIAEACTHAPLTEDIGREKIPRMLKKRIDPNLQIDIVSGNNFPEDVRDYDLIIHCGACMFNRKYVLSRLQQAKQAGVPITNYGVTIAYVNNILDKISI